jgi:hypothetical protein
LPFNWATVIFTVDPLRVKAVAGMAGERWSMLYRTAASLSPSVVEILMTMRNPFAPGGAWGGGFKVPCHVPVMLCADTWENDSTTSAMIPSISFFMKDLLEEKSLS